MQDGLLNTVGNLEKEKNKLKAENERLQSQLNANKAERGAGACCQLTTS